MSEIEVREPSGAEKPPESGAEFGRPRSLDERFPIPTWAEIRRTIAWIMAVTLIAATLSIFIAPLAAYGIFCFGVSLSIGKVLRRKWAQNDHIEFKDKPNGGYISDDREQFTVSYIFIGPVAANRGLELALK